MYGEHKIRLTLLSIPSFEIYSLALDAPPVDNLAPMMCQIGQHPGLTKNFPL